MIAEQEWITTAAGVKMPRLIYGTAWKKEHTAELVVKAVHAGFRGIDTACQPKHYNEPQVGEALRKLQKEGVQRSELFVQSKFTPIDGQDPNRVPYDKTAPLPLQVAQSFEASKRNLQTQYLDSLVLHSPLFPYANLLSVWRAMETIHENGGARQLGLSNCYDLELLKRLYGDAAIKPAVIQNRFYADSGYDVELRAWCDAHNIIYQSFWSLTANPHLLASNTLQAIAAQHGKTPAQLFFRYLNQCGIIPLTGTTSGQHMKEDLDSFDIELSAEALQQINDLLK